MLNRIDAALLRLSHGYMRARTYDDHLRKCHGVYREFYKEIELKHPPVIWDGLVTPQSQQHWQELGAAHDAKIKARELAIQTEVAAAIDALDWNSATYAHIKKVLHPTVKEYWRDNARHQWRAYQAEAGGMIDLGIATRQAALDALGRAATEVNVIYIDDYAHFIFFRTPASKG